MISWLLFVQIVLTVCWGTYLAVESHFPPFRVPRDWLIRVLDPRDERGGKTKEAPLGGLGRSIAFLIGCPWCTSAYVSAAVVYVTQIFVSVPLPGLVWASACMLTGVLSDARGWGEERYRLNRARVFQAHEQIKRDGFQLPEDW